MTAVLKGTTEQTLIIDISQEHTTLCLCRLETLENVMESK
jgi:hypothetical protein